jgi:AcrR family transcriptional regulator
MAIDAIANRSGRTAQRSRTRKAIVQAAGRLLGRGERPTLDDIAQEAEVSRATAYRYFPGLDALLSEAAVDALVPDPGSVFAADAPVDPSARLHLVDEVFDRACREREVPLRLMLARIIERSALQPEVSGTLRQNRRVPLLEEALAPLRESLPPERRAMLVQALAMIIGTEGFLTLKDVVGLDAEQAGEVRRWAIDALLTAALER